MERARRFYPGLDFYVPSNKEGFVAYLIQQYPKVSVYKWLAMKKHQLKGIYLALRTRRG